MPVVIKLHGGHLDAPYYNIVFYWMQDKNIIMMYLYEILYQKNLAIHH